MGHSITGRHWEATRYSLHRTVPSPLPAITDHSERWQAQPYPQTTYLGTCEHKGIDSLPPSVALVPMTLAEPWPASATSLRHCA